MRQGPQPSGQSPRPRKKEQINDSAKQQLQPSNPAQRVRTRPRRPGARMPVVRPIISRFTMGELSPLLGGRVDLAKYPAAMRTLENFIPLLQGPVKRRGGTRFVAQSGNGDQPVLLIDFTFSETTTYIIEAGHRYMRFFSQGGPVLTAEGEIYQIETPWRQEDLFNSNGVGLLKYVQSGDVLYIVCPGQPPQKLSRHGHTDWRVAPLGGWNSDKARPNATAIALWRERLCLAAEQTLYLSQSGAFENFYLTYQNGKLKAVITKVEVMVVPDMMTNQPNADITVSNPILNTGKGYVVITSKEDLAGNAKPIRVQISFKGSEAVGVAKPPIAAEIVPSDDPSGDPLPVAADDPIEINVYSEQMDRIEWLCPAGNLLVGTTGGEFIIGETTTVEPMGPENVKIVPETAFGSTPIQALRIGAVIIFVQRAGRKVREFVYDFAGDSYTALDLTVAAEHITRGGVTAMAWQSEPIETLWMVRGDGQLLGFTYSKDQDMNAWHRHILGGGGRVSHLAVVPARHGGRDELWLSVKREINGRAVYYLEVMDKGLEAGEPRAEAFFVDASRTYRGKGLTEVTGLDHLEGCRVSILGDGGVQSEQVVRGGPTGIAVPGRPGSSGPAL